MGNRSVYTHPSFPKVKLDGFPAQDRQLMWDAIRRMKPAADTAKRALLSGDLRHYKQWFELNGTAHLMKVATIVNEIQQAIVGRAIRFVDVGNGRTNSEQDICGYVILGFIGLEYQAEAPRTHLERVKAKLKQLSSGKPQIEIKRPEGYVGFDIVPNAKGGSKAVPKQGWDVTKTYSKESSKRYVEEELEAKNKGRKAQHADVEAKEGVDDEIWVQVIVKTHDNDVVELADTLYHELSHVVGRTWDVTYNRQAALNLAAKQPQLAVANATNYAHFMREFL